MAVDRPSTSAATSARLGTIAPTALMGSVMAGKNAILCKGNPYLIDVKSVTGPSLEAANDFGANTMCRDQHRAEFLEVRFMQPTVD